MIQELRHGPSVKFGKLGKRLGRNVRVGAGGILSRPRVECDKVRVLPGQTVACLPGKPC